MAGGFRPWPTPRDWRSSGSTIATPRASRRSSCRRARHTRCATAMCCARSTATSVALPIAAAEQARAGRGRGRAAWRVRVAATISTCPTPCVLPAGSLPPPTCLVPSSAASVRITQQENYERALRDLETEFAKATSTQRTSTADEAAAQIGARHGNHPADRAPARDQTTAAWCFNCARRHGAARPCARGRRSTFTSRRARRRWACSAACSTAALPVREQPHATSTNTSTWRAARRAAPTRPACSSFAPTAAWWRTRQGRGWFSSKQDLAALGRAGRHRVRAGGDQTDCRFRPGRTKDWTQILSPIRPRDCRAELALLGHLRCNAKRRLVDLDASERVQEDDEGVDLFELLTSAAVSI